MLPVKPRAIAVVVMRGCGESAKALLLLRTKGPFSGSWSLVTGRIQPGESAAQAAVREVAEEAGLTKLMLYTADYCDVFYDVAEDAVDAIPIFVAKVSDDATPHINAENADHRWVDLLEAADMVPFVGHATALRQIHEFFVRRDPPAWMRIQASEIDSRAEQDTTAKPARPTPGSRGYPRKQ